MLRDYPVQPEDSPGREVSAGAGLLRPGPQRLRDQDVHLMSAGPTGNLSLPPMPAAMPAAEVYQAAAAVTTPR